MRAPARACRRCATNTAAACRRTRRSVPEPVRTPKVQSSTCGSRPRVRRHARTPCGSRRSSSAAFARSAGRSSLRLGRRSRRLRRRGGSARLGRRRGLGRGGVPRLLPRGRAADSAVARSRLAAPRGAALGRPLALVYTGLAIGVALAVPLETRSRGRTFPTRRTCSISGPRGFSRSGQHARDARRRGRRAGKHSGRRPLGNALILAGVGVAALGSGLAGLGVGALAPILAIAAVLLYAGFVLPTRRP